MTDANIGENAGAHNVAATTLIDVLNSKYEFGFINQMNIEGNLQPGVNRMKYTCPVCDYPDLVEEPYFSYEICPCCGTEFGYDDFIKDHNSRSVADQVVRAECHKQLRIKWEAAGKVWFSPQKKPWE